LESKDGHAALDENAVHLRDNFSIRIRGENQIQSLLRCSDLRVQFGLLQERERVGWRRAFHLQVQRRAGQQLGDWTLSDDFAVIDNGDRVARALDLVEEV
jgi:hypothetical protein